MKPGRSKTITVKCKYCGNEFEAIESRVKVGWGLYCSMSCKNKGMAKGTSKKYVGKENACKVFDKTKNAHYVYWFDASTLKRKTSTYAHWWWEVNKGEIPDGYRASYKDGDATNISPENIILRSPEEFGAAISERLMGHGFSGETLEKMRIAKEGKLLSEIHKQNIGKATKQMWKDGVFDAPHIREAYSKQGKSTKDSKRTPEQLAQQSQRSKGKDISRLFTPEALEKRRQKLLGRTQSKESNLKRSKKLQGREFSEEHLHKLSLASKGRPDLCGERSRWWRGGKSEEIYPIEFSTYLKGKIRRRDNHECQVCGLNVYKSNKGHVHHIDGDKANCSEDNLILLCTSCHRFVHNTNEKQDEKILELRAKLK
jgi:hypothetical protein